MAPTPESDLLPRTQPITITIASEPAINILNSMLLLSMGETLSGLDEWVGRTVARMSPAQFHRNRLVLDGLHHALLPERRWPNFTAYLEDLASSEASVLRDRLIWHFMHATKHVPGGGAAPLQLADAQTLIASPEAYLDFLRRYGFEFDEAIEVEAHTFFNDPPAMQELIVEHLRGMWQGFLSEEWERAQPLVQESVSAFQQIDFTRMTTAAAFRAVTGQELNEKWEQLIANRSQLIFVPSPHIGPYLRCFKSSRIMWVLFGARLPEGVPASHSALSRSDLLVRLSALTDDTRLRILALLSQHDELCAQDIMTLLDLTQSAASRHLRQLSATGYVTERRREIAKCYSLNRERIGDTFRALERFLTQT
jgi:DNA-binding transcriptional ArsR family regulator